jgi:hypothetical protein
MHPMVSIFVCGFVGAPPPTPTPRAVGSCQSRFDIESLPSGLWGGGVLLAVCCGGLGGCVGCGWVGGRWGEVGRGQGRV